MSSAVRPPTVQYTPSSASGTFDAAVIRPVQPTPFCSLFLIDLLFLSYAADCAAKPDADVEGHRLQSCDSTFSCHGLPTCRAVAFRLLHRAVVT